AFARSVVDQLPEEDVTAILEDPEKKHQEDDDDEGHFDQRGPVAFLRPVGAAQHGKFRYWRGTVVLTVKGMSRIEYQSALAVKFVPLVTRPSRIQRKLLIGTLMDT